VIVVDASAMVEALIGRDLDSELRDALAGEVAAPHLLDVEVLSALRGLLLGGKLEPGAAEEARVDHFALSLTRYEIHPLADRIWFMRHQYNSYDACYLALAEALDAPLYTCDAKLVGAGHGAQVRVFPRTQTCRETSAPAHLGRQEDSSVPRRMAMGGLDRWRGGLPDEGFREVGARGDLAG